MAGNAAHRLSSRKLRLIQEQILPGEERMMNWLDTWLAGARWFDAGRTIRAGMDVWPGDRPVAVDTRHFDTESGMRVQVSGLSISCHAGTHLDAPRHMAPPGLTIDRFPPDLALSRARVLAARGPAVTPPAMDQLTGIDSLLFKTDSWPPGQPFPRSFAYLAPETAHRAAEAGVRLVGIDSPSVDPFDSADWPAHRALFVRGIFILENLNLTGVPPGDYLLLLAPLPVEQGDGSPVRPLLVSRPDRL